MRPMPVLLAATLALPALAADLTIDDIAPPETMFIARISDWSAMSEAFMGTPMSEIAERDDVRTIMTDLWESDDFAELRDQLAKLDVDPEDFPMPAGHVATAMWPVLIDDIDDEFAYSETHYIILADFGERAEEMYDLIVETAEQDEKDGVVTLEFEDEGDYEVMSIVNVFDADTAREESLDMIRRQREEWGDDFDDEFWDEMEQNILNDDFEGEDIATHAVRAGDWVLMTSHRNRLSDAIEVIDGGDIDSLAGDDELADLRDRVQGAHADFILMPGAISSFLDNAATTFGFFLPEGILTSLGIDQVEGMALAVEFDTPDAQAEVSFAMPMSGSDGIFSLITSVGADEPPAFVPSDASSYAAFAVDWNAVLPFARDVILSLPDQERAAVEAQFATFSVIMGPIFQSLGTDIITYSQIQRPLSGTSEKDLYAIEVANEAVISAAINQYGQMMGLEVRDFLGSQIFEAPPMMGVPFAVGLGQGWALIAPAEDVENALRQLSSDDPDSLATTDAYRDASDLFKPAGASYSFADVIAQFEFQQWVANNAEAYVRATMQEDWVDDEFIGWMVEDLDANPLMQFLREAPDISTFRNAIGPTIQDLHITEEGITSRVMVLEPSEE